GGQAGRQVDDAHVAPEDAAPEAGAERLGAGLLGRVALGVAGGAQAPSVRLRPLDLGEHAVGEAVAVAFERPLDAADVDDVAADADDHRGCGVPARASSINARMRRMAPSSPTKIASPTRKWPIL